MNNYSLLLVVAILSVSILACNNPASDESTVPVASTLSVSAVGANLSEETNSSAMRDTGYVIQSLASDVLLKTERKEANRGTFQEALTPVRFILDIDTIQLYKGIEYDDLWEGSASPNGMSIPQHVDLSYADNFIRNAVVRLSSYDGLTMQFIPTIGDSNGLAVRSLVALNIPAVYDGVAFKGVYEWTEEIIPGLPDGLRYFSFADLQPFDTGSGLLSSLTIGTDFTESGIQNPAGDMGLWQLPGGRTTEGDAVAIFTKASRPINLEGFIDPELVFVWNLENLVEIYKNDSDEYILTFRLDDPFPISLTVKESTTATGDAAISVENPDDVFAPCINVGTVYPQRPGIWNVIQWINPADQKFDTVVIVRKANSAPVSKDDGEIVYSSYKPNYVDATGTFGVHYYYRVYTVSKVGVYSDGVVLDHIQPAY